MKKLFGILLCGLALTAFTACGDDGTVNNGEINNKGLIEKSCDDFEEISGEQQEFKVTIKTDGEWKARLSQTKFVSLKEGSASGAEGESEIVMVFTENGSDAARSVTLSVTVGNNKSVTVCRVTQRSISAKGTDAQVNREFTWPRLDQMYLWNADLRKYVTPDYNMAYDEFLEDVIDKLRNVNIQDPINAKDGYWYPSRDVPEADREWVFYSNISRTPVASSSSVAQSAVTRAVKAEVLGFGIWADIWGLDNSSVCFPVLWVYPGSPAAQMGIKRGDIIYKVDGARLLEANNAWQTPYVELCGNHMSQGKRTVTMLEFTADDKITDGASYTLNSGNYYETPVVFNAVLTNADKTRKVGYVVYNSFESAYDSDLKDVFDKFKSNNITDVIVDLRYNGGGEVSSAKVLCSILGGSACLGNVFEYYRYNDERMQAAGYNKNDYKTWRKEMFDETLASSYGFNFDKIFIIGTYGTASASELTINALRGIGKNVVLVGDPTNGKDVGMEVLPAVLNGYQYSLAAITFQSYNSKGESDYDNGFTPDVNFASLTQGNHPLDYYLPMDWGLAEDGTLENGLYIALNYGVFAGSQTASMPKRMSMPRRFALEGVKKFAIPEKLRDFRKTNMYMDYQEDYK
ncbi:MAG: hypothetical protein J6K28_04195 [Alistipes sp.]|nr:hypothetical protein [Alistipes sp.]